MVTHQMEEVERLCDRVILLKNGAAEAYGTVEDVQDLYGATIIKVHHAGSLPPSALYDITVAKPDYAELTPDAGADEADILRDLVEHGVAVRSFTTARTSLEEIFIKVYGEQHQPVGA
jgi:ABC-2 type transport system ATP-binding protein